MSCVFIDDEFQYHLEINFQVIGQCELRMGAFCNNVNNLSNADHCGSVYKVVMLKYVGDRGLWVTIWQ